VRRTLAQPAPDDAGVRLLTGTTIKATDGVGIGVLDLLVRPS